MNLKLRQFFDSVSSTYTYLLFDELTREALIIDPVLECFQRDSQMIEELQCKLCYVLETHVHADHITAAGKLKNKFSCKIAVGEKAGVKTADLLLKDGATLSFGEHKVKVLLTPGHTSGCTSFYIKPYVFTGDALMIRGCGRTDFQEGDSKTLFHSVREKLFSLPAETQVFPGHDYKGRMASTIEEEKKFNPRLNLKKSLSEFVEIMGHLNLKEPAKMKVAVPANLVSGLTEAN